MGLFTIDKPKMKKADARDTYYIEPTKESQEEQETHETYMEQEKDKGEIF
jgi:hypothetical protein